MSKVSKPYPLLPTNRQKINFLFAKEYAILCHFASGLIGLATVAMLAYIEIRELLQNFLSGEPPNGSHQFQIVSNSLNSHAKSRV